MSEDLRIPLGISSNLATSLLSLGDGGTELHVIYAIYTCNFFKFTAVAEALLASASLHHEGSQVGFLCSNGSINHFFICRSKSVDKVYTLTELILAIDKIKKYNNIMLCTVTGE